VWVVCYRLTHIRLIELIETIEKGDIEAVKQHLAAGADVNAKDEEGLTPLHLAAGRGHKKIVELLIAKDADVNAKLAVEGETPLHLAAWDGHKEIAELLIAKGADVNVRDKGSGRLVGHGRTPIDLAILLSQSSQSGWDLRAAGKETADLLRKHGGKTGEELKAEGN
jgi:cytohesin